MSWTAIFACLSLLNYAFAASNLYFFLYPDGLVPPEVCLAISAINFVVGLFTTKCFLEAHALRV